MDFSNMDFSNMDLSNEVYSAPLQQLMKEHKLLRVDMDRFYELTEDLEYGSNADPASLFMRLVQAISTFRGVLQAHSKREEEALFPMIARRLGKQDRTIETMETEHEKAEQHLHDFLHEAEQAGPTLSEDDAQTIAIYAVQAYTTLTQHFAKEEKMLFPLAEQILSVEEKDELNRLFQEPR